MSRIAIRFPLVASVFTSLMLCAGAAQSGVVTVGGLSNFDVSNNTGQTENEFEIEFPSLDPSKISSFWSNATYYKGSGYGQPTERTGPSSDGIAGHTSTYVDYKASGISTPIGFTEHFGVHFNNPAFLPVNTIYNWKNNGAPFNYSMPTVQVSTSTNALGGTTVTPVVTNTTNQSFFVQFHAGMVIPANPEGVQLTDLVDTNTEVQTVEAEHEAGDNGLNGVLLRPGEVLGVDGEAHDPTDSIITNPQLWLSTHPGEHGFGVDLNNAGDSALATLSIFAVDTNGQRGANVGNVISAINTQGPAPATPVPSSAILLLTGVASFGLIALRRRRTAARRLSA